MDHTATYRISWTRDPKRESAALLVALRGRVLLISVVAGVVLAVVFAFLHYGLVSLVLIVGVVALPINLRSKIRRALLADGNGDGEVRVALSGRGVRVNTGGVAPWTQFTHWKQMPHDIVLLQRHGRQSGGALLIPLHAIKEHDREGVTDLLDRHLQRMS